MPALRASVSPLVLVLLCCGLCASARAGSFTVPPAAGPQEVSGTDTGSVATGATLDGGADAAITWSAPATDAGISIVNDGTITSGGRAIDSASDVTGILSLVNTGIVASTDDALRIKGSFAAGTLEVTNEGVVRSAEGQAIDLDAASDATASVYLVNSGTVASGGSDAVRLGGGSILILNSGTIETTAAGKRAIKMDTPGNLDSLAALTILNEAGGIISGTDDGIKISSESLSSAATLISISNGGIIRSTVDGQAIDLGGIATKDTIITINNDETGLITAADDDAIQGANGMEVYNSGTIRSSYAAGTADTQNNSAIKIDGEEVAGGMRAVIVNEATGTISGAYHGIKASGSEDVVEVVNYGMIEGRNGSGVNSNGTGVVLNYGKITGTFDPAASFGDGDGVDFDRAGAIFNYGTIAGLGSKGTKPGETSPSTSEGIAIGGGSIVNGDAETPTALISGANNGILADDSNGGDVFSALSVINSGTIRGEDGFGIRIVNTAGTFGNTIVNYGTISGTTFAVAMGDGDDLFVYEAGSKVVGAVKAEGGRDTFRLGELDGAFDLSLLGDGATYQGFERLTLATGSSWIVTGSSDFAGATRVLGATLLLGDAALAGSAVAVARDGDSGLSGYLLGTGTIGALAVGNGGVVVPGSAGVSGTLSVVGDVRFGAGSTYQVHVSTAGTVDLIDAGGGASIDGGARVVLDTASTALDWGTAYVVLSADGGVSGNFGAVSGGADYLFLTPVLGADATDIYLTLERNGTAFSRYAVTSNQRAVALSLDLYGRVATAGSSALYDTLVEQTSPATMRTAFTQLAGDIHASIGSALFNENALVNDTLLGRARQAGYAGSTGAVAALGFGGPASAYVEPAPVAAGPFKAVPATARPSGPVLTAWAQGYGQWVDSNAGPVDASTRLGGALVGLDATDGSLVYGFAVGYSSSSTSSGNASADADTARIAGYAGASLEAWKLRLGADIGWSTLSTSRAVALTGEQPQADYDGTSANLFGEVGYTLGFGAVALEPFAGIAWSYADLGSFTETGAPVSGLSSGGTSLSTPYSTLGLRAAGSFAVAEGARLTPYASAGWRHAFGDVTPTESLTLVSTGTAFTSEGVPLATDSMVVTGGFDLGLMTGITLGLAYDGSFGDGVTSNAGRGVVSVKF
ncbi:autotransporter domain-containing protein [Xanthobacter agilis]|uniref:Outer membrane autotransporter protein n=1 Tax=Xanthobacter agilis TaxID=47492 RepID=A0ABU0LA56_XANAG|nr:autotransporter domain-containing protein [Xanthobacter agilis]MDQ0504027.1 outer membrane autotransporter protein [Xanthobacter agilis]